jgi:hypothetical protein
MLKRLWTQIVRFVKALEGIDDPAGDYMFSLGKRVVEIERVVAHLEVNCICALAAAGSSSKWIA